VAPPARGTRCRRAPAEDRAGLETDLALDEYFESLNAAFESVGPAIPPAAPSPWSGAAASSTRPGGAATRWTTTSIA
jgi:hypothetical protein